MSGAVVLFSGGQDSTTCLAWAIRQFGQETILPISFEYGQRHAVELVQASKIADELGVIAPYVVSIEGLTQLGGAALTDHSIEVEAEASPVSENKWAAEHNLPSTFVPGRNMLFLTFAAAYGAKYGVTDLVTGVCEADAAGYPDCRGEFIDAAQMALTAALDDSIRVHAPLLTLDKARTFALAEQLGVLPIVIEHSHTCYHGDRSKAHDWGYGCGSCPACIERMNGWRKYAEEALA